MAMTSLSETEHEISKQASDHLGYEVYAWSGSPDPVDPDNYWIDDETGERVNASTGER